MSNEEKAAHRTKHGIPDTLDKWIEDGKTYTKEPTTNPHSNAFHKYLSLQDIVECIFNVVCKEASVFILDLVIEY